MDGRRDPARILSVVREIDADVLAVQEVESRQLGDSMLDWLARETGLEAIAGATFAHDGGHYGNGLLSRCPVRASGLRDLTWRRREPRGAIAADIECDGRALRVVATHLGLRPAERRAQVLEPLQLFTWREDEHAGLVGDLNEWVLWGRPPGRLDRHVEETPALAAFPSRLPL